MANLVSGGGQSEIHEILPKQGKLYQEDLPSMVLCKPKLLPLKSVTLEKLEKMQKDAEETVRQQHKDEMSAPDGDGFFGGPSSGAPADVVTADHMHQDDSQQNSNIGLSALSDQPYGGAPGGGGNAPARGKFGNRMSSDETEMNSYTFNTGHGSP